MRYQKIESQIWTDEKFSSLSAEDQRLFLYILSSPHSNLIGFYCLKEGYACEDLKLLPEQFRNGLGNLSGNGLINYDFTSQVVLVRNFLKHNPIQNPNQKIAMVKELTALPKNDLFKEFIALNQTLMLTLSETLTQTVCQTVGVTSLALALALTTHNNTSSKHLQGVQETVEPPKTSERLNGIFDSLKEKNSAREQEVNPETERMNQMRKYYDSLSPKEKQKFYYSAKGNSIDPNPNKETVQLLMLDWYEQNIKNQQQENKT